MAKKSDDEQRIADLRSKLIRRRDEVLGMISRLNSLAASMRIQRQEALSRREACMNMINTADAILASQTASDTERHNATALREGAVSAVRSQTQLVDECDRAINTIPTDRAEAENALARIQQALGDLGG
jgi:hypothetical protein